MVIFKEFSKTWEEIVPISLANILTDDFDYYRHSMLLSAVLSLGLLSCSRTSGYSLIFSLYLPLSEMFVRLSLCVIIFTVLRNTVWHFLDYLNVRVFWCFSPNAPLFPLMLVDLGLCSLQCTSGFSCLFFFFFFSFEHVPPFLCKLSTHPFLTKELWFIEFVNELYQSSKSWLLVYSSAFWHSF